MTAIVDMNQRNDPTLHPDALSAGGGNDLAFFALMVAIDSLIVMGLLTAYAAMQGRWTSIVPRLYFEGFANGYFFSLAGCLAIWAALFPGNHLRRNLAATLVLVLGSLVFALLQVSLEQWMRPARMLFASSQVPRFALSAILSIAANNAALYVLVFAFLVVPVWGLRQVAHVRVVRLGQPPDSTGPLRLKHLVIAITFLSCALAIARASVPATEAGRIAVAALGLFLFSLLFGGIYLVSLLGTRRLSVGLVVLALASQLLWYAGSHLSVYFVPSYRPRNWLDILAVFRGVQVATVAAALVNGLAARVRGYRLAFK